MTTEELRQEIAYCIRKGMDEIIGESTSNINPSMISNIVLNVLKFRGIINDATLAPHIEVEINGSRVDILFFDPQTNDLIDLAEYYGRLNGRQ